MPKVPKRKSDWVGLMVRSLVPLQNGHTRFPAGTCFEVTRNWSGLHLLSIGCPTCGIRRSIRGVSERDVEIVSSRPEDAGDA